MNLEANRKDFERALDEMRVTVALLDHCVDDALMDTLETVFTEYVHLACDIDELVEERDTLLDSVVE